MTKAGGQSPPRLSSLRARRRWRRAKQSPPTTTQPAGMQVAERGYVWLIRSLSDHGIDAGRPPRRQPRRAKARAEQEKRGDDEGRRVEGPDVDERLPISRPTPTPKRSPSATPPPPRASPPPDHHPSDARRTRADRETNSELTSAAGDRVRHRTIDPNHRDQRREEPKGDEERAECAVGALFVRGGTKMTAIIRGGSQERDRRAGTENVAGIVGFGRAAEIAQRRPG